MQRISPKTIVGIRPTFLLARTVFCAIPSSRIVNTLTPKSRVQFFNTSPITRNTNSGGNASTMGSTIPKEIINLTSEKYHSTSDHFLESLLDNLEQISEENFELIPEVELNQGVLNFEIKGNGLYVVNKQPPNKQIWLSSPISGPNRFDLFQNEWVSLRDNSKLVDIIDAELKRASSDAYSLSI